MKAQYFACYFASPREKEINGLNISATVYPNAVLTVSYFRRWGGVDLVDTGERDVLLSTCDVSNVIERSLRLERPVHEHVGIQTEHLQEYKVTACLEEVVLNLCHVAQAEPTRGFVDHMERHLRGGHAEDTNVTGAGGNYKQNVP